MNPEIIFTLLRVDSRNHIQKISCILFGILLYGLAVFSLYSNVGNHIPGILAGIATMSFFYGTFCFWKDAHSFGFMIGSAIITVYLTIVAILIPTINEIITVLIWQ